MKILIVFGTRPEAIKMAPIIKELEKISRFEICVCVTGQHRQMLDQVLKLFDIKPKYDLNLMRPNQTLTDITIDVLKGMNAILDVEKPNLVLVHGDTTTSFVASLSCFYKKIKVGHVEAGLRTNDIYSPWPEEANRQLTSKLSEIHFAPTNDAKLNLIKEGVEEERICVTGNSVIDALFFASSKIDSDANLERELADKFLFLNENKKMILVTGHRRENFGEGFEKICSALRKISENKNIQVVYPVHLNPRVQEPVKRTLAGIENIYLIEPQDYLPFIYLMKKSYLILTDSGGIQEEAPSLGKPVLVMRNTTERPEAVAAGSVKLVGTDENHILKNVNCLIDSKDLYMKISKVKNPYGEGDAAIKIVNKIKEFL